MHDVGIMFAGENVTRPAHVCSELVNFIKPAIDNLPADILITQIADNEIISRRIRKFRIF